MRIRFITILEKFQQYHHGTEMNMKIYGTPEPPQYDLSKVRTNIHLLHGTNDWLTPSDVSLFNCSNHQINDDAKINLIISECSTAGQSARS